MRWKRGAEGPLDAHIDNVPIRFVQNGIERGRACERPGRLRSYSAQLLTKRE
jgi:hypothetical protein